MNGIGGNGLNLNCEAAIYQNLLTYYQNMRSCWQNAVGNAVAKLIVMLLPLRRSCGATELWFPGNSSTV